MWGPTTSKLALGLVASESVETHVHGFDSTWNDGVVANADGGGVISLDGRFGLRPTHFNKGLAHRHHFLGGNEECT